MTNNDNIVCEQICEHSDAIEILTNAFRDYKNSVDERLDTFKTESSRQILKSFHQPESVIPVQATNHLMNYIMKGDKGFAMYGGYSLIPEIDYVFENRSQPLMMKLATVIKQTSGTEHDLAKLHKDALVENPGNSEIRMVKPEVNKITLEKFELGIFLQSQLMSSMPKNFENVVYNALSERFAKIEDSKFLSDDGIDGKIKGIGNLTDDGYKTVAIDYAGGSAENICAGLMQMLSKMPQSYIEDAVWLMSPEMYTAISSIRKLPQIFMASFNYKNPTLLGLPVHLHPKLAETQSQIILANVKQGYTYVAFDGILALHDQYRDRNGISNYFTRLVGGAVTNKEPWVSATLKSAPSLDKINFKFSQSTAA